jgi:uncharacterized protein (DUF2147 family)
MKTSCAVMLLALLNASSAHAGSVVGALINASGARFAVKNCGTDTCGTIAWGKQRFVVKRSDVPAIFKELDPRTKAVSPERDKTTVIADPPKPTEAAPPTGIENRTDDRTAAPRRNEEANVARSDERFAPPSDTMPSTSLEPGDAVPPAASKTVTEAPALPGPVGTWIAENGEGRVRIDPCGEALCGVVAAAGPGDTDVRNPDPSKRNRPLLGVPVLIDMKPTRKERWEGQIYSAKSGYTYAATIALKSVDVLRIEGCVLGGLFCSSQNWTRDKDAPTP